MNFETVEFPSIAENNPNPDWDLINKTIKEIYAKDDEEIQKKAREDAIWLENYLQEQSKIDIAIKERQKEEQKTLEEAKKLKQQEEERNIKAREILEELIDKMERQRREENDPVLRYFKKMFETFELGPERDIERRQD